MFTYQNFSVGILVLLLAYSTLTDISVREISIPASIVTFSFLLAGQLFWQFELYGILLSLGSGALLFILMLPNALFWGGGGGDCILFGVIGFALGARSGLLVLIFSSLLLVLFHLMTKNKETHYPMAPFILAGVVITTLLQRSICI